jgi:hypothetical protein
MRTIHRVILVTGLMALLAGCDKGIAPESTGTAGPPPYGVSGTVYFQHWPPVDSVIDLRVVAFTTYPPGDIVSEVLSGRAKYTNTLPYGVDSVTYSIDLTPIQPGSIPFIAVGQQYGQNIQQDWRLVGEYYTDGDTSQPGSIYVPVDSIVPGVNIFVDFNNPPHLP